MALKVPRPPQVAVFTNTNCAWAWCPAAPAGIGTVVGTYMLFVVEKEAVTDILVPSIAEFIDIQ